MPRPLRLAPAGLCFHVINRGNGRATVFHKAEDYAAFLRILALGCERIDMRLLAWCLMPNHFHLVLWPLRDGDLARWMQWVTTCHVRRYHRHYKGSGHVWQGRYKAFVAQDTTYLLTLLRYVERNPVRAGLAVRAEDWPWSSAEFAGSGSFSAGSMAEKVPDPLNGADAGSMGSAGSKGSGTIYAQTAARKLSQTPPPKNEPEPATGSMGSGTFLGIQPPKKKPDPVLQLFSPPCWPRYNVAPVRWTGAKAKLCEAAGASAPHNESRFTLPGSTCLRSRSGRSEATVWLRKDTGRGP